MGFEERIVEILADEFGLRIDSRFDLMDLEDPADIAEITVAVEAGLGIGIILESFDYTNTPLTIANMARHITEHTTTSLAALAPLELHTKWPVHVH
jgi:hypothetical protein